MDEHQFHKFINYYRGLYKVLEEDWQKTAQKRGITSAEQHILWILHFQREATMSELALLGLWDISTVMQVIKRLKEKGLVKVIKDKEDRRISYASLTEKGVMVRDQSRNSEFQLYRYLTDYINSDEEHSRNVEGMIAFLEDFNGHFYGEAFSSWVEQTSKQFN